MLPLAELTLALTHRAPPVYAARLTFHIPNENESGDSTVDGVVRLDPTGLNQCWADPEAYGRTLSDAVFADDRIRTAWTKARAVACENLRIRLHLEEFALELHRVRWEALHDPDTKRPLLIDQGVWFSRYLASFEMKQFRLRTKSAARVLVAVVSPTDLGNLRVGGRDFQEKDAFLVDEAALDALRAEVAVVTPAVTILPNPDDGMPTLDNLVRLLRTGTGYDVLYLTAHGALDATGPKLLLVDNAGTGKITDAADLVREINGLRFPPRLVVLSSCQSAGPERPFRESGQEGQLDAAFGPQLGRVGVPAVLAMLGNVYQKTARNFLRTFFAELAEDGQIDRAAMEARHAVRGEPDFWSPVLYSRLPTGRLWRDPNQLSGRFDQWPGLLQHLQDGRCVPVLGSGLLEPLIGSTQEIANRLIGRGPWIAPYGRIDLPQVAQYMETMQKSFTMRSKYLKDLKDHLGKQFPELMQSDLDPSLPAQQTKVPLDRESQEVRQLLAAAAARLAVQHPPEAHDLLARLKCPVYITTNPDDLLPLALRGRQQEPVVQVCNWLWPPDQPPGSPPNGPAPPTPDKPLVWQLFGHLSNPWSVVLSEDDYFKFLVGMSRENANPKPSFVNEKLTESGLLFVGFHLDDWDFRAFLHFFLSREAAKTRKGFQVLDVAVQLNPEDGRNTDPDRVRRYLEALFRQSEISIFWGNTDEFLKELADQWPANR
jgi:hypothetical protein